MSHYINNIQQLYRIQEYYWLIYDSGMERDVAIQILLLIREIQAEANQSVNANINRILDKYDLLMRQFISGDDYQIYKSLYFWNTLTALLNE